MRVLVLGAGATGAYFGSRLIESGARVSFLVRPQRAALLERDGLRVMGTRHSFAANVDAIAAVEAGVEFDLVLLSCKAYDLESAIAAIAPAVGPTTRVLPLLNGLRHLDALDAAFGAQRVLGGLCHISVNVDSAGAIRQVGTIDRLTFGSRQQGVAVPEIIRDGLMRMSVEVGESDDILAAMWRKFTFLSSLAGVTTLLRGSVGEIVAVEGGADLATWIFMECAETARRSGYAPSDAAIAETLDTLTTSHSPLKASMLRDLERGARTEVEHVLGDMLARARAHAIDTPLLSAACAHLRMHEARLSQATGPIQTR